MPLALRIGFVEKKISGTNPGITNPGYLIFRAQLKSTYALGACERYYRTKLRRPSQHILIIYHRYDNIS